MPSNKETKSIFNWIVIDLKYRIDLEKLEYLPITLVHAMTLCAT